MDKSRAGHEASRGRRRIVAVRDLTRCSAHARDARVAPDVSLSRTENPSASSE